MGVVTVYKSEDGHGCRGSRIVWMSGDIGITNYSLICAYAPGNAQTKMEIFGRT